MLRPQSGHADFVFARNLWRDRLLLTALRKSLLVMRLEAGHPLWRYMVKVLLAKVLLQLARKNSPRGFSTRS